MSFIIAAAVMILIAAACVAMPLWRARARPSLATDVANRSVHAARIEELERDVATGRLASEDFITSRRDLDRELEANLHEAEQVRAQVTQIQGHRVTAVAVTVLLILAVSVLYWQLGNWRAGIEGVQQASVMSVEQMVAQLSQRLATTDQNDLQGWEMLGHAYLLMGRYQDAADAYARARTLSADGNAEVLAGYGEALALAEPDEFMSKALPAFEKALRLDPRNPQALWYGGLGALQRGDKDLAVSRWNTLLAQDPPAEYRSIIEKAITAAGGSVAPATAAETDTASANIAIQIQVTLDSALRDKVAADETLYVFAEPVGQKTGPPIAVRRFQVHDLPLTVRLSDADSMLANRKLSDFSSLDVIARISRSGTAMPQAGDLIGRGRWQSGNSAPIQIIINSKMP